MVRGHRFVSGAQVLRRSIYHQIRVKPHALFTPRNVPIALCPKVQKELERMERLKVIE